MAIRVLYRYEIIRYLIAIVSPNLAKLKAMEATPTRPPTKASIIEKGRITNQKITTRT